VLMLHQQRRIGFSGDSDGDGHGRRRRRGATPACRDGGGRVLRTDARREEGCYTGDATMGLSGDATMGLSSDTTTKDNQLWCRRASGGSPVKTALSTHLQLCFSFVLFFCGKR
jgi:hypothetical protein